MLTPTDSSRTIRKLFNLREVGWPMFRHVIGDGRETFLWLDSWHPLGPLYKRFGKSVVYNLPGLSQLKVDSIIHNSCCKWPRARNRVTQNIMANTLSTLFPVVQITDEVVSLPSCTCTPLNLLGMIQRVPDIRPLDVTLFPQNVSKWAFSLLSFGHVVKIDWLQRIG